MKRWLALSLRVLVLLIGANGTYALSHPAHQQNDGAVTYLANEALMVAHQSKKVLFDPFFHEHFGVYQMVSHDTHQAMMQGDAPFDNVSAILISHAHDDHFSAEDIVTYLTRFPNTKLIAPQQAIAQVIQTSSNEIPAEQLIGFALDFGDQAQRVEWDDLLFEAVRIPHAGWPSRAEVENLVYRVTFHPNSDSPLTVMHMGDADPRQSHYQPHQSHWQGRLSHHAYPPYWFYYSDEGNLILDTVINAAHTIGVHVPEKVPEKLIFTQRPYFSERGQQVVIEHTQQIDIKPNQD